MIFKDLCKTDRDSPSTWLAAASTVPVLTHFQRKLGRIIVCIRVRITRKQRLSPLWPEPRLRRIVAYSLQSPYRSSRANAQEPKR
jgi:hypothetical protein